MEQIEKLGISCEQFVNSMTKLDNAFKILIEMYLSEDEIKELNNPRTKNRRKRKLIDIANQRMMLDDGLIKKK